jgi:brefeldin A-resistance guanine nucleotide exchange factor 1
MRDQVFSALDALRNLPSGILAALAEQTASGLARILVESPQSVSKVSEWNLVFSLWASTAVKEEAAAISFDLVSQLASGQLGGGLGPDNFVGFIKLLNDFAGLAGLGDVKYRNSAAG